ncbi:hypothetical protein V1478_005085 [Vespula squamosa]|uniref:Uncharacterized protein n=1 Tax=Vespula squamosa TaxID=30214 RepID=A0ABD2BD47_VESSQ
MKCPQGCALYVSSVVSSVYCQGYLRYASAGGRLSRSFFVLIIVFIIIHNILRIDEDTQYSEGRILFVTAFHR